MGRLADRVAVITGAASGIGAACAQTFAREGAVIAGFDMAAQADLPDGSGYWTLDVRDGAALSAAVGEVIERFGQIDILVNSAGVATGGDVRNVPEGEWDRVLDINLKGTFLASKHVLGPMLDQGRGAIINLASIEGMVGFEGQAAYNASKGGVILLTRNMAVDYGRRGVRVNCICPGLVMTPLTEVLTDPALKEIYDSFERQHHLGRVGQPDDIANVALFLASDEAAFVHGASIVADGGFTAGHRFS